jgi:hypothetical protein
MTELLKPSGKTFPILSNSSSLPKTQPVNGYNQLAAATAELTTVAG